MVGEDVLSIVIVLGLAGGAVDCFAFA